MSMDIFVSLDSAEHLMIVVQSVIDNGVSRSLFDRYAMRLLKIRENWFNGNTLLVEPDELCRE